MPGQPSQPAKSSGRGEISKLRIVLGVVGLLVMLYGVVRLLQHTATAEKIGLAKWLVGAVILHDVVLGLLVVGVGALLNRYLPPRGRGYVQGGLTVAAVVTLFTLPLIYRHKKSQPGTTELDRNYLAGLLLVLGLIAAGTAVAYATRLRGDARRSSTTKALPPTDQESTR